MKLFTLSLFFLFLTFSLSAQWQKITEPEGRVCLDFKKVRGNLYASIDGKMNRSVDNGRTWQIIRGLTSGHCTIDSADNKVWLDTPAESYVSTDNGVTFVAKSYPSVPASDLDFISHKNKKRKGKTSFYFSKSTLWRSEDGELTWQQILRDSVAGALLLNFGDFSDFEIQRNSIFLLIRNGGILSSQNNGRTWHLSLTNEMRTFGREPRGIFATKAYLFCVTDSEIYRTANSGFNWVRLDLPIVINRFAYVAMADIGNTTYLSLSGERSKYKIFESDNNGSTWTYMNDAPPDVLNMSTDGTELFAASTMGIFQTVDERSKWLSQNNALQNLRNYTNFGLFSGDKIWIEGYNPFDNGQSAAALSISDPQNDSIFRLKMPYDFARWDIIASGDSVFLYGGFYSSDSVYLSKNQGKTWQFLAKGFTYPPYYNHAYQRKFAFGQNLYVSGRRNDTLMVVKHNPFTGEKRVLLEDKILDWTMNPAGTLFGVHYSSGDTSIWVIKNGQITKRPFTLSTPTNRYVEFIRWIGGRLYVTWNNNIYVSENEAQTWRKINLPITITRGYPIITGVDSLLFVAPYFTAEPVNGVFFSSNYGADGSWRLLDDNAPTIDGACNGIVVTKNYVYALLESQYRIGNNIASQIWRMPLNNLVTSTKSEPNNAAYLRLFPNPATNIVHWDSPLTVESLKVYDILGRPYTVTYEQNKMDISCLPQGTYFVVFSTAEKAIVRKIVKN